MAAPAASLGSQVVAVDTHLGLVPMPAPVPVPLPHLFAGLVTGGTVGTVLVGGLPAAVVGSTATNTPPHLPTPPSVSFAVPPTNQGTVLMGSATVLIGGQPAARLGDTVLTCNDPAPMPVGTLVSAVPTVLVGG